MNNCIKQRKINGIFCYWNKQNNRWDTNIKHSKPIVNEVINREVYFEDYTMASDPVPAVCKKFTCGRHLTLREQLAGDICIHCADVVRNESLKNLSSFIQKDK